MWEVRARGVRQRTPQGPHSGIRHDSRVQLAEAKGTRLFLHTSFYVLALLHAPTFPLNHAGAQPFPCLCEPITTLLGHTPVAVRAHLQKSRQPPWPYVFCTVDTSLPSGVSKSNIMLGLQHVAPQQLFSRPQQHALYCACGTARPPTPLAARTDVIQLSTTPG